MSTAKQITGSNLDNLKRAARTCLPDVKNSHRLEALARGLGFSTYATMLAATKFGPAGIVVRHAAFVNYLAEKGFDGYGAATLNTILTTGARSVFDPESAEGGAA